MKVLKGTEEEMGQKNGSICVDAIIQQVRSHTNSHYTKMITSNIEESKGMMDTFPNPQDTWTMAKLQYIDKALAKCETAYLPIL